MLGQTQYTEVTQSPSIGDLVQLPDGRQGFVQNVRTSPYWPEEAQGIIRVYIYSAKWFNEQKPEHWVEWALIEDCEVIG